jgi:hypothetical protein
MMELSPWALLLLFKAHCLETAFRVTSRPGIRLSVNASSSKLEWVVLKLRGVNVRRVVAWLLSATVSSPAAGSR